jgi:hypothetical protein
MVRLKACPCYFLVGLALRVFHLVAGLFIFCRSKIMNRAERRAAERQQNNLACKAAEPAIAPEPISAARLATNRENALHSTGPKTDAGKPMRCLMSLVAGSQVISMFVAGPVAEKIGIPNLYYGSAAMLVGNSHRGVLQAAEG